MRRANLLTLYFTLAAFSSQAATPPKETSHWPRPKMVLVLVIDQFRADYLMRFQDRFLPAKSGKTIGGFKYLMEKGAYYPFGEYDTLQCMTGPGHATILSGSLPYLSGIPVNGWYDQEKGQRMYCVQDDAGKTIGATPLKSYQGTTPKNFNGTTVGDELKNSGYTSKVVAIAVKDRASILLGGQRADMVIWHNQVPFKWVTSDKYAKDGKLPAWVEKLNAEFDKEKGTKFTWEAKGPGNGRSDSSVKPEKSRTWGIENDFPHVVERGTQASFSSPYGIEINTRAAMAAIKEYKMGRGRDPDLLAVSLSIHDYLAHGFGPNSREMEEITVTEDREISKLLNFIQTEVPGGLDESLIVLTADHGGPVNPDLLQKAGAPAGRISFKDVEIEAEAQLEEHFGKPKDGKKWLALVYDLNFYLDWKLLEAKGERALLEAQEVLKKYFEKKPYTQYAITPNDVKMGYLPPGHVGEAIRKTYYPGRSGDLVLIPKAYWQNTGDTVDHVTPWAYDRYVPLVLAGRGIRSGRYAQGAKIIDLAPTLSFLLQTTPPAFSEGRVLHEAIR